MSQEDEIFIRNMMKKAIALCKKHIGKTTPNPTVGCIITDKENNILSCGVTGLGGRPHAEQIAISNLSLHNKQLAHNMFVTLEPCCQTSIKSNQPCVELIKQTTIKNVYIGLLDPNPRITSKSLKILDSSGIRVQVGICENEIFENNFGFFKKHMVGLPKISYKIATSLDGKISCKNGQSKWITNEKSRHFVHQLRNKYEAILTTSSTIDCDNPELNVRKIETKLQPALIILDKELKLFKNFKDYKVLDRNNYALNKRDVIVIHSEKSQFADKLKLDFSHSSFVYVGAFNLSNIFSKITQKFGFSKILIEAGGKLLTSMLKENLIDTLYWFHGSKIIGNDGISVIGNLDLHSIQENLSFNLKNLHKFDNDSLSIFINKNYKNLRNQWIFNKTS